MSTRLRRNSHLNNQRVPLSDVLPRVNSQSSDDGIFKKNNMGGPSRIVTRKKNSTGSIGSSQRNGLRSDTNIVTIPPPPPPKTRLKSSRAMLSKPAVRKVNSKSSTSKLQISAPRSTKLSSSKSTIQHQSQQSFDPFSDADDFSQTNEEPEALTQAVTDLRETRAEAQQRRMNWRRKKAEMENQQCQELSGIVMPEEKGNSDLSGFISNNDAPSQFFHPQVQQNEEIFLTVSPTRLAQLVEERVSQRERDLEREFQEREDTRAQERLEESEIQIARLRKEVEELKFFQELTSDDEEDGGGKGKNRSKLKKTNSSIQELMEKNANHQLEIAERRLQELEMETQILRKEKFEIAETLQEVSLERETAQTNLNCYKINSESVLQKIKTTHQEEIDKLKLSFEEMENIRREKKDFESKLEEAYGRNEKLQEEYEETCKNLQEGVEIMKGLEEELMNAQTGLAVSNSKVTEYEKQIESLQSQLEVLDKDNKEQMDNKTKQIDEINIDISKSRKEVIDLEKEKEEMQKEILNTVKEKEKVISDCDEKIELMEEKQKEEIDYLKSQHVQELNDKNEEIKSLKQKLVDIEKRMILNSGHARIEIDIYKNEKEKIQAECEKKLKAYIKKECFSGEQLQESLTKILEVEETNKSLRATLSRNQEEMKKAEEKIADLSVNLKSQMKAKTKDHQYMRDRKKWISSEQKMRQEISALKDEISKYHYSNKKRSDLEKMFDRLQKEKTEIDSELKSKEATIEMYSMSLENNEEKSNQRIKSLEDELYRIKTNASSTMTPPAQSHELGELRKALIAKEDALQHAKHITIKALDEVQQLKSIIKDKDNKLYQVLHSEKLGKKTLIATPLVSEPLSASDANISKTRDEINQQWSNGKSNDSDSQRCDKHQEIMAMREEIENNALGAYMKRRAQRNGQ